VEVLCVAGFENLPHNTSTLCEPRRREEWVRKDSPGVCSHSCRWAT